VMFLFFLQNRYLVDKLSSLKGLSFRLKSRLFIERLWLLFFQEKAHRVIVQTSTMEYLTKKKLKKTDVQALGFVPSYFKYINSANFNNTNKKYDFIYVASGEIHKNHLLILEAWCMLATQGFFPSLAITILPDTSPKISSTLKKCNSLGGKVHCLGTLDYQSVLELYNNAKALIYPSYFESFGLPLLEARNFGIPILAPELDFVRDIVNPSETFDPHSPISILRAVKRHLYGINTNDELISSSDFLQKIVNNSF